MAEQARDENGRFAGGGVTDKADKGVLKRWADRMFSGPPKGKSDVTGSDHSKIVGAFGSGSYAQKDDTTGRVTVYHDNRHPNPGKVGTYKSVEHAVKSQKSE